MCRNVLDVAGPDHQILLVGKFLFMENLIIQEKKKVQSYKINGMNVGYSGSLCIDVSCHIFKAWRVYTF